MPPPVVGMLQWPIEGVRRVDLSTHTQCLPPRSHSHHPRPRRFDALQTLRRQHDYADRCGRSPPCCIRSHLPIECWPHPLETPACGLTFLRSHRRQARLIRSKLTSKPMRTAMPGRPRLFGSHGSLAKPHSSSTPQLKSIPAPSLGANMLPVQTNTPCGSTS